jgi:hypothetical protein
VASLNSPPKILKLWLKAVKKHEEGKKPVEMPKKGQDQKTRIKKGLTTLRTQAAADMSAPAHRKAFESMRDKVAKVMRQYCRYLKTGKDEDKKVLPRYLKSVKQLTILVQNLSPKGLDMSEDDVGVEALDEVDDAALDKQLAQVETGADEIDLEAPPSEEALPQAEQVPGKEAYEAQRKKLDPRVLDALKNNKGDTSKIRAVFSFAQGKAEAGDYGKALQGLEQLEALLRQAGEGKSAGDGMAAWKTARSQVIQEIRAIEANIARTKDPLAGPCVLAFESIIKNLSAEPTTPQNIAEIEAYLNDEIVILAESTPAGLGKVSIRAPLSKALAGLKKG